jgi:hypothetical protein
MTVPLARSALAGGPERAVTVANDAALANIAHGLSKGGQLRVNGLLLAGAKGTNSLELERFDVFAPDARIVSQGKGKLAIPENAYFRGSVDEYIGSLAVFSFHKKGDIRGWIVNGKEAWILHGKSGKAGLNNRKVDLGTLLAEHPFDCATDDLAGVSGATASAAFSSSAPTTSAAAGGPSYTARVAVETDNQFWTKFGDDLDATNYVGDLFAFASSIYAAEVDTSLEVSYLRLWPSGVTDPWNDSPGGTDVALYEYRDYWNANEAGVSRTIGHMLSGKSLGGGIAWVSVLCHSSLGYGLSASLSGNFDINNPVSMWDILVVNHEIGHNFSSSHTQNYCNVDGIADPVDRCYNGCMTSTGLPSCSDSRTTGEGTIMSYCHLVGGGYSNISLTFGGSVLDGSVHACGVAPDRVPNKMYSHVVSRAASYPTCLEAVTQGPVLSVAKAGTGNGTVTSDPAGISCGVDCSQSYADAAVVALTASPDGQSTFSGWSGDADCGDGSVTMSVDVSCTATFKDACGNGVREGSEECDGSDLGGAICDGCNGVPTCTASCTLDTSTCYDGVCDVAGGESCGSCAQDCVGTGAICGNGTCEAGDGENCLNCPTDCDGRTGGKKSNRFCCGTGDSYAPDGCDAQCGSCTTASATTCCGDAFCGGSESSFSCEWDCGEPAVCGDGTCDIGEDSCSCAADCGAPPATETSCTDGISNDCDGDIDCDDADCSADPACEVSSCSPKGTSCNTDDECCSLNCVAKGKSGKKCR